MDDTNISQFKHSFKSRVRLHDVDRQNIVHNAVYMYWLEVGRVEYYRDLGLPIDNQTFITKHRFVMARLEVDYVSAAQFDDEYEVLTRVSYIKNSSFGMEQIIRLLDGRILLKCKAVLVNLNAAKHNSERIPESFRRLLQEFEGDDIFIEVMLPEKY